MSLRRRLLFTLGVSLAALWLAAAGWMLVSLHQKVRSTLDQRLAASAHMVAGLIGDVPASVWRQAVGPALSTPPGRGVACQIRSLRGEVLLRTSGDPASVFDDAPPGYSDQTRNGRHWRVFTEVHNGLVISVADRLRERRRLQLGIVLAAVLPFLVALIGGLGAGWWSIRRGLAPLDRLREELARRDPKTLTPVVVDKAPAELAPAISTLNRLLQRTDDAMWRERRFTSHAAHELRTPLTAIKTHLQLAQRLEGERRHTALAHAETGVARLQRTLEQLLLLARVESDQPWPETASATVAGTIQMVRADLGLPASFPVRGAVDNTPLDVPRELAAAALRNLIDNARKHSGAADSVRLHVTRTAEAAVFDVLDEGTSSAIPEPRRFERGQASGGSGLGLAIVKAIVTRFDGELAFERRQPQGLLARLRLPVREAA